MVIPMGGDAPLGMGPPPERVQPRLRRIKACLVVMVLALVAKLAGQILLQPSLALNIVVDSLDAVLVAAVGVFVLKDDPFFGKIHACIVRLCCRGCEDQCPGGVYCLCTWFAVCLITALSDLLGDVQTVYIGCRLMFDPGFPDKFTWYFEPRSGPWFACMAVFLAGLLGALLAQIVGAWQGMKGFMECQEALLEPLDGAGAWQAGAGQPQPGGQAGGPAPFSGQAYGPPQPSAPPGEGPPPARGPGQRVQPSMGFQPFGGQGQRLGD